MNLQQPGVMKVWKSPVLYFGIFLVVAVVGLLLAPFIIDWNSYRSDLEAYGKKLTGREVTIEGPISARLFPWPRLTAEQVKVANPPGLESPNVATAERITIRMTLAGLLQGGLDVESIEVEKPSIMLERRATGEGNWVFSPSQDLIRSDILSRVRLDQISLTGGTVTFSDRRRGETHVLNGFNAEIASPGVAGPWRLRSQALYNDKPIDLSVSTGSRTEGDPLRFSVTAAASDGSGYAFNFDGETKDGKAKGNLRVEPASAKGDGKSDAEGSIRPLLFTAKAEGDFETIDLTDIELSRLEPGENGAIATGSAALRLGSRIEASLDLKSAMLDVDSLAGAESRTVLREKGPLAVGASLLTMLPQDVALNARMAITALKSGNQTLDNVAFDISAENGQARITRFAAGLPGRSDVLFSGSFAPGRSGPELDGQLALETSDLRELAFWLWPRGRDSLDALWSGSRGRIKMQTDLVLTQSRTELTNADFELDGERGKGSLTVTSAGRGAIDLTLEGNRFDLDAFAPGGVPTVSVAASQGAAGGLLALALPRPDAPDLKLRVTAGEVLLNAVTAQNVTLDLQSGANGLDLRGLEIGSVGGARVAANGLILDTGRGADGTISLEVAAGDPSELIRLLGLAGANGLPTWAQGLGQTAIRASLAVKPVEQGSEFQFRASGNAGDLNIASQGTSSPGGLLSGNLAVTAASSGRILSLLGLPASSGDTDAGALRVDAAGTAAEGFNTTATVQAHGARLDYRGNVLPWAEGYGIEGQLSLRATDAATLLVASGLPAAAAPGGVSGEARISWADGKWSLADITGQFGTETFNGSASLSPAGEAEARIHTGPLRLTDVLAATFLEWAGPQTTLESGFAAALPFGLTGKFWLTPSSLDVIPGFAVDNAEIGIAATSDAIQLFMAGKDKDGRGAQVDLSSTGADGSRNITGVVSLPLDLATQLATADGAKVASGHGNIDLRFESGGRSPAGALAAVRGEGSYKIDEFRLLGLTPDAFSRALADAKDAAGISRVFDALRGGEGTDFGSISGRISVADGQMTFDPVSRTDPSADITLKTVAELALGQIDIDIGLQLKLRDALPPMSISYAGPPAMLSRAEDSSELSTALGVTIMQQGIDELERLQQEQQRLARIEEQQRIEDEARLQAYYAQRDELLLRRREVKVLGEMQVAAADRLRKQIEAERAANTEINKGETRQRLRELRTWRRLARLAETPPAAAPQKPINTSVEAPAKPKPPARRQTLEPVILAKPPGAPVVISAPPGASPSQ